MIKNVPQFNLILSAMKKLVLFTVLLVAVCSVSFGKKVVAKGQTFTAMGDYKIETIDNPVPLMGSECVAYSIKYENSPMDVKVVICKDNTCKRYLVISDKLSVQYVCRKEYFGVEIIDKKYEPEGYQTSAEHLNKLEYYHQKVLGPGQKPELEATQLIAAYFPRLIVTEDMITAAK
jgi:hypothetical protein